MVVGFVLRFVLLLGKGFHGTLPSLATDLWQVFTVPAVLANFEADIKSIFPTHSVNLSSSIQYVLISKL